MCRCDLGYWYPTRFWFLYVDFHAVHCNMVHGGVPIPCPSVSCTQLLWVNQRQDMSSYCSFMQTEWWQPYKPPFTAAEPTPTPTPGILLVAACSAANSTPAVEPGHERGWLCPKAWCHRGLRWGSLLLSGVLFQIFQSK